VAKRSKNLGRCRSAYDSQDERCQFSDTAYFVLGGHINAYPSRPESMPTTSSAGDLMSQQLHNSML
jgi:hypothetical protein